MSKWTDNYKRYNPDTEGYGDPGQWRRSFKERMGSKEAKRIIRDDSPEAILGITEKFYTLEYLKKVFREKIMQAHPDKGGSTEDAQRIIAAYTVLKEKF